MSELPRTGTPVHQFGSGSNKQEIQFCGSSPVKNFPLALILFKTTENFTIDVTIHKPQEIRSIVSGGKLLMFLGFLSLISKECNQEQPAMKNGDEKTNSCLQQTDKHAKLSCHRKVA